MSSVIAQKIYLDEELRVVNQSIRIGFAILQRITFVYRYLHPPLQLIASGFERFMKSILCLYEYEQTQSFPNARYFTNIGHDLISLKNIVIEKCYTSIVIQKSLLAQDLNFINNNLLFTQILDSLSNFGGGGRYYNLDIVTQHSTSRANNYDRIWEKIESNIANHLGLDLMSIKTESQGKKIYFQIYTHVIQILEQFIRALSRLLIKANLGKQAASYSGIFHFFLVLEDDNLGLNNYSEFLR